MNENTVREVLEAPFPDELIKTRPGSFGQQLSYVEGHTVIQRLNEAFGSAWTFEVIEHRVLESEVLVLGKLTCELGTKMAFGGSSITYAKDSGEVVSIVDDLKSASTDSLKKAATLLGIALALYSDNSSTGTANDTPPRQRQRTKPSNGNGNGHGNGDGDSDDDAPRLSTKQLSYLLSLGKDRGLDRTALDEMAVELHNVRLEFLSKGAASAMIDELRAA